MTDEDGWKAHGPVEKKEPPAFFRLRRGEERQNVAGRNVLIGLVERCEPNHGATIRVSPQISGVPISLLVDNFTAENFQLEDFRIGRNSLFVTGSAIPLSMFAVDVEGFPGMNELKLWEDKYRELIDLEPCPAGMDIELSVTSNNPQWIKFRGAILFRCHG